MTSIADGRRLSKDHIRIEAYGQVDELNALLGVALCEKPPASFVEIFDYVQNMLFVIGSVLAMADMQIKSLKGVEMEDVAQLEKWIDALDQENDELKNFILPRGCKLAAKLHHARTVARRVERAVVTLANEELVDKDIIVFFNRLSDLLFVMARRANGLAEIPDQIWKR